MQCSERCWSVDSCPGWHNRHHLVFVFAPASLSPCSPILCCPYSAFPQLSFKSFQSLEDFFPLALLTTTIVFRTHSLRKIWAQDRVLCIQQLIYIISVCLSTFNFRLSTLRLHNHSLCRKRFEWEFRYTRQYDNYQSLQNAVKNIFFFRVAKRKLKNPPGRNPRTERERDEKVPGVEGIYSPVLSNWD